MKRLITEIGVLGLLALVVLPGAWGQTSLIEMETTMKGMEELSETSVGPSVAGPRPAAPPGPVPGPVMPTVPEGPVPAEPGTAPAPAPAAAGGSRVVLAPENGFVPTTAAQMANLGFENMTQLRFNEALEAYRRAKEVDSRYEAAYQGIVQITNQINQFGVDIIGQIVIAEEPMKTTISQFFGWRR